MFFQYAQLNSELLPCYQAVQFTQASKDIGYGSVQVSWEHKYSLNLPHCVAEGAEVFELRA